MAIRLLLVPLVLILSATSAGGAAAEPGLAFASDFESTIRERGWREVERHGLPPEPAGSALFESPQSQPIVLGRGGRMLYVANTTSHSVSVIDTRSMRVMREISVGLDPVALALRPDGRELWVSNHISDSISVIDTARSSPSRHQVTATIHDIDREGISHFDEPVGIAFASNEKAYVALSASNEIAIIDIDIDIDGESERYRLRAQRLLVGAQEPRAIAVRAGRLYVASMESNNQTELNLIGFGLDKIAREPTAPDRDVYVYDTESDTLIETISSVGTLLYGLAVDGRGRVFVAHTEARNDITGGVLATLIDLENRPYLNRIARIDCGLVPGPRPEPCDFTPDDPDFVYALEAPPGEPVAPSQQMATPYGIAVSRDDETLVVTAAASDRVATIDAASGAILGQVGVGASPRGVALQSHPRTGAPWRAYVLNTLANTVTQLDLSRVAEPRVLRTVSVGRDPTPALIQRGRIAFNSASASSSGTFACASCHPDAHLDQLVWRIGGALAGSPIERSRTTQSIRGLRNTLPLHWDGSLGDPFGGPNGTVGVDSDGGIDCALTEGDRACFRDLVDASLGSIMCDQSGPCPPGGTLLAEADKDAMAAYLASVWHAPPPLRRIDDRLSTGARKGVGDFFLTLGVGRQTCAGGACHALPLLAGTNGIAPVLGGFDAPSLRGIHDRYRLGSRALGSNQSALLAANEPMGQLPPLDTPNEFPYSPEIGYTEASVFGAGFGIFRLVHGFGPVDVFQMLGELGTGTSGATGRQITLDARSLSDAERSDTLALLSSLEASDRHGVVGLNGTLRETSPARDSGARHARRQRPGRAATAGIAYVGELDAYRIQYGFEPGSESGADHWMLRREQLLAMLEAGGASATLTARLPERFGEDVHRQPLLLIERVGTSEGHPQLYILDNLTRVSAVDILAGATLILDGQRVAGEVLCLSGDFAPRFCSSERVELRLAEPPRAIGLYMLQVQNPDGAISNELPVCVGTRRECKDTLIPPGP